MAPAFKRILLKLSGEALMGDARVRHRPGARGGRRAAGDRRARPGRGACDHHRRWQHSAPRHEGRGSRHGPRDGRLHGDARHGAQRAAAAGRAGEDGHGHARAVRARGLRGRRALHPPPRHAPPREGPRGDLRRRHGQPVLHDRHRRGPARRGDPRRDHPDGRRTASKASTAPIPRSTPARRSSPRSPTWRRSSGGCA